MTDTGRLAPTNCPQVAPTRPLFPASVSVIRLSSFIAITKLGSGLQSYTVHSTSTRAPPGKPWAGRSWAKVAGTSRQIGMQAVAKTIDQSLGISLCHAVCLCVCLHFGLHFVVEISLRCKSVTSKCTLCPTLSPAACQHLPLISSAEIIERKKTQLKSHPPHSCNGLRLNCLPLARLGAFCCHLGECVCSSVAIAAAA